MKEVEFNEDAVVHWMEERDYWYREELSAYLGWDFTVVGDRKTRAVIAKIAKKYPMISLSNGRGYKLVKMDKYRESKMQMQAQIEENKHRATEILKRNKPLLQAIREMK